MQKKNHGGARKGSGAKPKGFTAILSFHCSPQIKEKIKILAERHNMSFSEASRIAIEDGIRYIDEKGLCQEPHV